MSDTTTGHDQYYEMANAPVNRIIPKLAVPTIISMLVTSIYNTADTFFVSQLGTSASGATGIVFSAMAIIQALSFMVGMEAVITLPVPSVPESGSLPNR